MEQVEYQIWHQVPHNDTEVVLERIRDYGLIGLPVYVIDGGVAKLFHVHTTSNVRVCLIKRLPLL